MKLREYKIALPYAIALPIAIALIGILVTITDNITLLPLNFIPIFLFPYLAARKTLKPIRVALFTALPFIILQSVCLLGIIIMGILPLFRSGQSSHMFGHFFAAQLLIGNIIVICLISVLAGWVAKISSSKKQKNENLSNSFHPIADSAGSE